MMKCEGRYTMQFGSMTSAPYPKNIRINP